MTLPPRPDLGPHAIALWPGVGWTFTETVVVFLAVFGLGHYVLLTVYGILRLQGSWAATIADVLTEAAAPVVVLVWLRVADKPKSTWFGRAGRRAADIGIGIAVGFGIFVAARICLSISYAIARAFGVLYPAIPRPNLELRGGWLIAYGFLLIVVAPFCEEILFRGFLFRGFRSRWAWWPAALLSALLFAVVHASPYRLLDTLAGGLILAGIYEGRKSLLASMAAHSTLNTIVFVLILRSL